MQLVLPPAGGKSAEIFLVWEFNGKLPQPTWEEVVGQALARCCNPGFPSTKLLFFKASTRGRSTHTSSVGAGCCVRRTSILPSVWDSPDPQGVSLVPHTAMTSRCPQATFADTFWESTWASLSLPSPAVHSKGGGSIAKMHICLYAVTNDSWQPENIHLWEIASCDISAEQRYFHPQAGEGLQGENCFVCRTGRDEDPGSECSRTLINSTSHLGVNRDLRYLNFS